MRFVSSLELILLIIWKPYVSRTGSVLRFTLKIKGKTYSDGLDSTWVCFAYRIQIARTTVLVVWELDLVCFQLCFLLWFIFITCDKKVNEGNDCERNINDLRYCLFLYFLVFWYYAYFLWVQIYFLQTD